MRNVWILNHYGQEPGYSGGTRHFSLAQKLVAHGWQASIIAASIEHGTGRDRLPPGVSFRLDSHGGTPFLWLKTSTYSGNGSARVRNMLDYTCRALMRSSVVALAPPDAIIGSSVHPLAAWAGARLARRYCVPFMFEVRDLWPQTLVDMGQLKSGAVATRLLRNLETRLYREAFRIIVLLPHASDYIESLGIPREKVVWIPNGVDLALFPENPLPPKPSREFKLMYFGAHGQANGLQNVLEAMHRIQERSNYSIFLRLIGDGPMKPALRAMADGWGLANVSFEDPVPKTAIPALCAEADAFIFNLANVAVFKYGISSNKMFDYMAAGRPIIMASEASNNPIADAGAGLTVPPESPEQLAEAIIALAQLPHEQRVSMGAAGHAHVVKYYSFELLAARLAKILDEGCEAR